MAAKKSSYDFAGVKDRILGRIRNKSGKVTGYSGRAKPAEAGLLMTLIEFAPNIEPSITALCLMLCSEERQIRRLIESCEKKGLLRVERRPGRRSRYIIDPPPICPDHPLPICPTNTTSKDLGSTTKIDTSIEPHMMAWNAMLEFKDLPDPEPGGEDLDG